MSRFRPFALALASVAVAGVVAQVAATTWRPDQLWGFHLWYFTSPVLGAIAWIVTLVATHALLREAGSQVVARRIGRLVEQRPIAFPVLGAAAFGIVAWLLRSRQTLLGDASPLLGDLGRGPAFHPREPLTMEIQHVLHDLVAARGGGAPGNEEIAALAVALGSVGAGVLFALLAFAFGRSFAGDGDRPGERGAVALLAAMVVLSQGYATLFFGYLENYTYLTLAMGAYAVAAFSFVRGRLALAVPIALLALCLALHTMSIVLLPSLVVLVAIGLSGANERRATLRDLALGALAFAALDAWIRISSAGDFTLASTIAFLLREGRAGESDGIAYAFSLRHLRDFLDAQYLIGPLAAFLFLPAAAIASATRTVRGGPLVFAVAAAGFPLLAHWLLPDPVLGYARDWDLFAPAGAVMTISGVAILLDCVPRAPERIRLLGFAWLVSALHLAPWVALNASEARSLARFELLPLGGGRTEVVLGNWYRRQGRDDEAIEWLERAVAANPNQNNAFALLGTIWAERGRTDRAAELYTRAVSLRPDKPLYRRHLVDALLAERRFADSLPHSEWLCAHEPEDVAHWLARSRALYELGRAGEGRAVLERALERFLAARARDPGGARTNHDVGIVLAALDRYDEAMAAFDRSLAADPRYERSLYNAASLLMRLGRAGEARPYVRRLLELPLDPSRRALAESWLATPE